MITIIFYKFIKKPNELYGKPIIEYKHFHNFKRVLDYSREKHVINKKENYYVKREPYKIILHDGTTYYWSDFCR